MDAHTYTSIVYTFALAWMVVAVLAPGIPTTGLQTQNLLWALGLAVFSTLLGHTMMNVSLKYFKAPTVSAVMLITVITAPLGVLLVLGEVPTYYTLLGGGIILIGLGWYLTMERRDARRVGAGTH
jgi:drug/metabolite transporter (DMT)-like permease